jgi:ABC-type phosphate transport system substrate-binding protein
MPMRRYSARLLLYCLALMSQAAWAAQIQVAVITAPTAPRLSFDKDTLRNIYLKRIFVDSDGVKLTPVNLSADSPLRDAFTKTILHMSERPMQDYWDKQYFQGVSPPYVLASDEAVVRFVAATPGAVGYVASCHADASIRVVMLLPLPPTISETGLCADRTATP